MKQSASEFTKLLSSTPCLPHVPEAQVRIVSAMRYTILAHRQNKDIEGCLVAHFGTRKAARRFAHILETMGDIWPEPVMIHAPKCPQTTYDEMLLLDLVTSVIQKEPAHFHGLLCDMIPEKDCERLHIAISRFLKLFREQTA
ncbi:hypothetical protein [Parasphingorhabdus cellanae]|uniref:Addiction module antidote protein n=1 Tax=Parasphingorhabdus cellanae TaxID=2806553 RepID=A0ABX7SYT7_9SPHN|nr:hypothetical protein [Parasphingorhabdus cellanae]QTD54456.1 hypothetical protein J4G78_09100 [Parasphingorhabdus cellanae]